MKRVFLLLIRRYHSVVNSLLNLFYKAEYHLLTRVAHSETLSIYTLASARSISSTLSVSKALTRDICRHALVTSHTYKQQLASQRTYGSPSFVHRLPIFNSMMAFSKLPVQQLFTILLVQYIVVRALALSLPPSLSLFNSSSSNLQLLSQNLSLPSALRDE